MIETTRFGRLEVGVNEEILVPEGMLGFPELTRYCLVDPGDETLILWLQSLQKPEIVFPVIEPKIFKPDYTVRLSAAELRELALGNINQSAVFSILTIPEDVTQMTANLKAPLVINLQEKIGKQVVLQENEYGIKHLMFKELRTHLITMASHERSRSGAPRITAVSVRDIPPSLTVRSLRI